MAARTDPIEVLTAAKLWPPMMESLRGAFTVHDRTHQSDAAAFAAAAPRIRAIAASGESKVPRELIAQLPELEIVSVFGVGYDGVDVAAARERGIAVTHTPNVLNDEVADLAMALVLAVSRRLIEADRYVRSGAWANGPMPLARKVSGARMGIVGLGRIGMAIAKRAEAFGMSIAYTSRNARADAPYPYFASAEALAREVDFLVVITPGGAATRKLIDAKVLAALGKKGYLVNVARGSVVDEQALVERAARRNDRRRRASTCSRTSRTCRASCSRSTTSSSRRTSAARPGRRARRWPTWRSATSQAHFAGKPLLSPVPYERTAAPRLRSLGQGSRSSPAPARASAWRSRAASQRRARASSSTAATRAKLDAAADAAARRGPRGRGRRRSTSPTPMRCAAASPRCRRRSAPVDILVNNAGIQHRAPIVEFSDADWRRLMATNLDAPFYMARAVIPAMQAQARRQDHQHRFAGVDPGAADDRALPDQQGRHRDADARPRGRARAARHPGQRDRAGVLSHRDEHRADRRTPSSPRGSSGERRRAAGPSRTSSPAPRSSSPRRRRASSPARSSTSTAASPPACEAPAARAISPGPRSGRRAGSGRPCGRARSR